jgi:hypothetical protein
MQAEHHMKLHRTIFALFFTACWTVLAHSTEINISQLTVDLLEDGQDYRKLRERHDKAPHSSWNPLKNTKSSLDSNISEFLQDVINKVIPDSFDDDILEYQALTLSIAEINSNITKIEIEKETLPEASLNPLADTRASADSEISNYRDKIVENEIRRDQIRRNIQNYLSRDLNINLDEKTLTLYLSKGFGQSTLNAQAGIAIISQIVQEVGKKIKNTSHSIVVSRSYYEIDVLLRAALVEMLQNYISENDKVWIPTINEKRAQTIALMTEAKQKATESDTDSIINQFNSIANSNKKFIDILDRYEQILSTRVRSIRELRAKAIKQYEIAILTLETVRNVNEFVEMVQDGQSLYSDIMNLEIPEFESFEINEINELSNLFAPGS